MKNNEKLILIDGVFEHNDAKEILFNVFTSKLQVHELKNFSTLERSGKTDETAVKRIPELKQNVLNMNEWIEEAKKLNKKLVISSEISISFAD
jgi:extradiol dioxygenase family protein